jgi:hypothetical protein
MYLLTAYENLPLSTTWLFLCREAIHASIQVAWLKHAARETHQIEIWTEKLRRKDAPISRFSTNLVNVGGFYEGYRTPFGGYAIWRR